MQQLSDCSKKEITFQGGNNVWFSTGNFKITRKSKKFNFKHTELYTIGGIFNKSPYNFY